MEIEASSLWREVEAVVYSEKKPVHYNWTADIHVGNETYKPLKVLNVDFMEDYVNKYGDEVIVRLALSGGQFAKRIYPYQDQLEITLYRSPILERADSADEESEIQTERYTATLIDKGNAVLSSDAVNSLTEEALDLANIWEIDFQLVNKALEQLRMVTVGGVWRNCTVEDFVKGILTTESRKVEVENTRMPQGVDMVPASNTKPREHINIPHGTLLVDVPQYVHQKCGGIYRAGLGYYLRGDFWYVYPCFDTARFFDVEKTMTVINVPKNKLPEIERTYRMDGTNLTILATGAMKFSDDSEVQQLNRGNGVRFADADRMMRDFVETKGNKTFASRGRNNSEFITAQRPNGNNNVRMSPRAITANPYLEYSEMARRHGGVINFEWQNSAPHLLVPGMMMKLLYLEEDQIMEAFGVLLRCHHIVYHLGKGLTEMRYRTSSVLSFFVQPLQGSADFEAAQS